MNSLSASVPLRTAARSQYLHLALRTCSGIACTAHRPASQATNLTSKRLISSTHQNQIKEYFPPPKNPNVKEVSSAWVHPVYVFFDYLLPENIANMTSAILKPKCETSVLPTEKPPIGPTGLLWELSVSFDGAWTSRQAIDTPILARNFRPVSK